MHIAFLNIYGGRIPRGAEVAIHELAKGISSSCKVTVYQTGASHDEMYHVKRIFGIPVITTDVSKNILFKILKKLYLDPYSLTVLYFTLRCLPDLLRQKYNIVIPINGFWQILLCKLVKLIKGGKIVVFGYSGIGIDDYMSLRLEPDAFFAMSHVAQKWAQTVNSHIPIKVLPGGVNTKIFRPNVNPFKLPLKHPIVLTVAALVPYKRIDLVIQAVAKIPYCSLLVIGEGILKDEIETMGRKLLPGRFLLMKVNYAKFPSLYTSCDIFTLPSLHTDKSLFFHLTGTYPSEAFGIVYAEAMSCGLPIVAPDDELRREIIGPAGIFVDCTNADTYADGIKKALSRTWSFIPRKQAEKYDWEEIVSSFMSDLENL